MEINNDSYLLAVEALRAMDTKCSVRFQREWEGSAAPENAPVPLWKWLEAYCQRDVFTYLQSKEDPLNNEMGIEVERVSKHLEGLGLRNNSKLAATSSGWRPHVGVGIDPSIGGHLQSSLVSVTLSWRRCDNEVQFWKKTNLFINIEEEVKTAYLEVEAHPLIWCVLWGHSLRNQW